ncbi:signal recognition particle protein [Sphingomonas sp. RB56-2]|uniref:Signal recognition particle protein n=1 Tax=Sphingomonas brevis TaxID=2908206 RepID=A0ABT0S7R3_9SPHN|nr:signal recognition particle protein [Sphingomonas brevis]MCL6740167.1 signal recognition particle protein [Sphingomonas brevis]
MFDSLSDRLSGVFDKLRGRGALSEDDVRSAMREVRVALLEADVALPVARDFVDKVTERAVGQEVIRSVTPGQMVVKIVNDALVEMLGSETAELHLDVNPPAVIMMVGLQGSGKTTTTAKLAKRLSERERKRVLMASLDVARPAAQEQLAILGRQANVDTLPIVVGQTPVQITERALQSAKLQGYDILLLDTAGRLHVDDQLMAEMKAVATASNPVETLLVVDSLTGQDAVNVAKGFAGEVDLSGVILTRMDGDARGGAALSMRAVTGKPIKFAGTGEAIDALEAFHPNRVAGRILGMGDVVSLVERAAETVKIEDAEALARKMEKGKFDLDDLAMQIQQMKRMGGLGALANMLPGMKGMKGAANIDDKALVRLEAMMSSMTAKERSRPDIINAKRKIRIAKGSGTTVQEVNKLLKMHLEMSNAMKRLKKLGGFGKLASMFSGGGMEKALAGIAPGGELPGGLPGLPGGSSPFNLPPGFDKFSKK